MKFIVFITLSFLSTCALAEQLTGTLIFDKKAPFVGLLYANEKSKGPKQADVDQKDKQFTKKIAIIGPGGKLEFTNSDSFQHNIFANDPSTGVKFDVGLMETGQTANIAVDWTENTLTRVGCKIHPRMRTYIANVPSNSYQILEFEKKVKDYKIDLNVNNGQNKFVLMIPKYDKVEFTLGPGEEKTLDVTRKSKKKGTLTVTLK